MLSEKANISRNGRFQSAELISRRITAAQIRTMSARRICDIDSLTMHHKISYFGPSLGEDAKRKDYKHCRMNIESRMPRTGCEH